MTRALAKKPLYYVQFGPVGDGSIVPALIDEFSTGIISNATKTRKDWMTVPSGGSQSVDELGGTSTIGQIQFQLQDVGGYVTKMVSTYKMKNRVTTVYAGYVGLPESQYIPIFRGLLNAVRLSSDAASWTFSVMDFQRMANTTIFNMESQTQSDVSATDMHLTIDPPPSTTSPWFAPTTAWGERGSVNFLIVDDEIVSYSSWTDNGNSVTVNLSQRGLFGSQPKSHNSGATVDAFILLQGNPLDIYMQILMSKKGDKTNGPYDVLPYGQGCGIDQKYIDVKGIEAQRDRFVPNLTMCFEVKSSSDGEDAQDFTESEVLKVLLAFPLIKNDGRLSVKKCTLPFATDITAHFSDDNIVGIPTFDLSIESNKLFFNEVDFLYDYDPVSDEYTSERVNLDLDSAAAADERAAFQVKSKGVRGGIVLGGDEMIDSYAKQIFYRYGKGCPTITLETHYSQLMVELGDFVDITCSYLPNLFSRSKGGTPILCEVVDKSINFQSGRISFTLRATGYISTDRWCIIGPNELPDYALATSEQRNYGYICNDNGLMPSGEKGYKITP
jgi:hypothetical protein